MAPFFLAIGDFFARHGEPVLAGFFGGIAGSVAIDWVIRRYRVVKRPTVNGE